MNYTEPTPEQVAGWEVWMAERPESIREHDHRRGQEHGEAVVTPGFKDTNLCVP
jgi:hypothetical protein